MRTGKRVAIVGAGPAGLGCADILVRNGVTPVVFDRYSKIGGLLTFGIPPFKLEKEVVEKRREIMEGMGVEFRLERARSAATSPSRSCWREFDAVFLGMGTYTYVKGGFAGEDLPGVHEALPYLISNINRELGLPNGAGAASSTCAASASWCSAAAIPAWTAIAPPSARARRASPAPTGATRTTCPARGATTRTARRRASRFCSTASRSRSSAPTACEGVKLVETRLGPPGPRGRRMPEVVPGTEETIAGRCGDHRVRLPAEPAGLVRRAAHRAARQRPRARVRRRAACTFQTTNPKVFAGGDMVRGSDLVVTAVFEGREAAQGILQLPGRAGVRRESNDRTRLRQTQQRSDKRRVITPAPGG